MSDPSAVRRLFDEAERAFGGIDVAISNAGIMRLAPIRDMSDEDFIRMDIAAVISWLCAADGAWINGQTVFANGGVVCFPSGGAGRRARHSRDRAATRKNGANAVKRTEGP